jgi:hypothetical protein
MDRWLCVGGEGGGGKLKPAWSRVALCCRAGHHLGAHHSSLSSQLIDSQRLLVWLGAADAASAVHSCAHPHQPAP